MGIEIIRLGSKAVDSVENINQLELNTLKFHNYSVTDPSMNIWIMLAESIKPLFPWWSYDASLDEDVQTLNQIWGISNAQSLFDCLFLASLQKLASPNLYVIFPGSIKNENWNHVREMDRGTFLRGQGCVYHLQGLFNSKLSVQWVPFWQPQSLVRDPSFSSLWRLFSQIGGDDVSRSISFFHLSDPKRLPLVANLLIDSEEKRSEKISDLVDWFGVYSSPLSEGALPGSIVYSKSQEQIAIFNTLQEHFDRFFKDAQTTLIKETQPRAVIRFLSGHIAL